MTVNTVLAAPPIQPGELYGYSNSNLTSAEINKLLGQQFAYRRKLADGSTDNMVLRLVKNGTGAALTAKIVTFGTTWGAAGKIVNSSATTDGADAYVVYDGYPSSGIPTDEFFYIVDGKGTAVLTSAAAAGSRLVINVGGKVVASSLATIQNQLTAGTDTALEMIENVLGKALTALTTSNTSTSIRIEVTKAWAG